MGCPHFVFVAQFSFVEPGMTGVDPQSAAGRSSLGLLWAQYNFPSSFNILECTFSLQLRRMQEMKVQLPNKPR